MSEAWHQHLNNLTWWEQIDRFFNPSKYSCTTGWVNDSLWHMCLIGFGIAIVIGLILFVWYRPDREAPDE